MGENELYHLVLERLSDTHKNKEREIIKRPAQMHLVSITDEY